MGRGGGRINVCFHGIGEPERELDNGEAQYWITEALFLTVLDLVAGRGDVSLSFDDGNRSDARLGLPALKARGLTAAFFPLAGRLDTPGSLSSADLRELVSEGMSVGSHGWRHQPWRRLPEDEASLEFDEARRRIADVTGRPVAVAACPFGEYDKQALAELRRVGFDRVYTSDRARARGDAWLQARYSLTSSDSGSTVEDILRGSRLTNLIDPVRVAVKRRR
jgi:peptidoglycan/xylan/chitin deacetylase (PgdA/CDA1 family)